jgi:hypothetical protein
MPRPDTMANAKPAVRNTTARNREVECPKCAARLKIRRARTPRFDHYGFESYEFECGECSTPLVGVIDPYGGALLAAAR